MDYKDMNLEELNIAYNMLAFFNDYTGEECAFRPDVFLSVFIPLLDDYVYYDSIQKESILEEFRKFIAYNSVSRMIGSEKKADMFMELAKTLDQMDVESIDSVDSIKSTLQKSISMR